jgi:flagellar biosynthesis protein FlhG
MRGFDEVDHYDTLEIRPDATADEVERAYRLLIATWADDSLATYSMFGEEETGAMRDRIETAYRVLADPELRRRYDAAQLSGAERDAGAAIAVEEPVVLAPLAEASLAKPLAEARREVPTFDRMDDVEEADDGTEVAWDGARLRRARLMRGVEVEDVATATKISPAYLRFLEEERFDDLPAVVYVRGFVAAYARYLGLDAAQVSRSYGARFEEHRRAKPPRGRLLGHR